MACRSCGGGRVATPPPAPQAQANVKPGAAPEGMVLLEYLGPSENTLRFVGKATQTAYRFGRTPEHRQKYVFAADAPGLLAQGWGQGQQAFRQVAAPVPVTVTAPLVVRDRVIPPEVKQEAAQTFDHWSKPAEPVAEARTDPVWADRPAEVVTTLPISFANWTYTEIRNMVPSMPLEQAREYLAVERAGKNRVGVVKLLEAHIAALSEQVPA